jgi:hypothetical protein
LALSGPGIDIKLKERKERKKERLAHHLKHKITLDIKVYLTMGW